MALVSKESNCVVSNPDNLREIIASLYYLSEEANRSGLDQISRIIQSSIIRIKDSIGGNGSSFTDLVIDETTLAVLAVLNKISQIPKSDLKRVADLFSSFEE